MQKYSKASQSSKTEDFHTQQLVTAFLWFASGFCPTLFRVVILWTTSKLATADKETPLSRVLRVIC